MAKQIKLTTKLSFEERESLSSKMLDDRNPPKTPLWLGGFDLRMLGGEYQETEREEYIPDSQTEPGYRKHK
jgi:hypothetical protein